jgi:hypothetical protein
MADLVCEKCGSVAEDATSDYCGFCGNRFPSREIKGDQMVISKQLATVLVQGKKDADDLKRLLAEKFNEPASKSPTQNTHPRVIASTEIGEDVTQSEESLAVWKEISDEMKKRKKVDSTINDMFDVF